MSLFIISSNEDPASTNIKNNLLEQSKWIKLDKQFDNNPIYQNKILDNIFLATINDRHIRHENLDKELEEQLKIKPQQIIVVSRHRSKTGEPTLTTHPLGNYGEAKFGGKTKTLVPAIPTLMTYLLRVLNKNVEEKRLYHDVCFEVTHHGPYLEVPAMFVEIGSTEDEWRNPLPGEIIAKSLLKALETYISNKNFLLDNKIVIGIGGGHYAPRFTELALSEKVAFGHMIPGYQIEAGNVDEEMVLKAFNATPDVVGAYIHRKSMKKTKVHWFEEILEKNNIRVFRTKDFEPL